jgi:hypothetical protein
MARQQENARHDPFKRRKAQRHGREKGVRINLSAAAYRYRARRDHRRPRDVGASLVAAHP